MQFIPLYKEGYIMFQEDELEFEWDDLPVCNIEVKQWNSMQPEQQEEYIINNNIKVCYSHDISDTLTRGFGHLDQWGFWEYQCKQV
jgi:hypothetical protein